MRPCTPHNRLGCEACAEIVRRIRERAAMRRWLEQWPTDDVPTPRADGDE